MKYGFSTAFARDLETGDERPLRETRIVDRTSVSPDGLNLAMLENDPDAGFQRILTVSTVDGHARELLRVAPPAHIRDDAGLAWLPEADRLLFA